MSHFHIRLVKRTETISSVEYEAQSFDFSLDHKWEPVGKVQIDKTARNYKFAGNNVWNNEKISPPELYSLPEKEREIEYEIKWKPKGFGFSAYSSLVNAYATQFVKENSYPEKHPPVFFINEKEQP